MDKTEHGLRLKAAMSLRALDRLTVADQAGVQPRTVTNWTSGATMPSESERHLLRRLLGDYDNPGDPVEVAVRSSELHEWRQDAVLSTYKRNLHEQRGEVAG
jgi:transcriptional regulator with XRE-family HTH domain